MWLPAAPRAAVVAELIVIGAVLSACSGTRDRPAPDATAMDVRTPDVDLPDGAPSDVIEPPDAAADPDAVPEDSSAPCTLVAGQQACDGCDERCASGTACVRSVDLCFPRDGEGSCQMDSSRLADGVWCAGGEACLVTREAAVPSEFAGPCASDALCAAAERGETPVESRCVWSDGSAFGAGPTRQTCPLAADDQAPFCGGTSRCADTRCPETRVLTSPQPGACVGVSGVRGFGVCAWSAARCTRDAGEGILAACGLHYERGCACLVLEGLGPEAETGYPVLIASCLGFRDAFPGSVECYDQDWQRIP